MRSGTKNLVLGAIVAVLMAAAMVRPAPAAGKGGNPLSALVGRCVSVILDSDSGFEGTLIAVKDGVLELEVLAPGDEPGTIQWFVMLNNIFALVPDNPFSQGCTEAVRTSTTRLEEALSKAAANPRR